MALDVDALPMTVEPRTLIRCLEERSWTEPADEAAKWLISMSSITSVGSSSGMATSASTATAPTLPPRRPSMARAPHSKPDRLSLACDICRKRKVRCDAHHPKCNNCVRRGDVCVTSDPRRPGVPVAARKKTARRHTGPPAISSNDRLLIREAQQHEQRHALLQTSRDEVFSQYAEDFDTDDGEDSSQDQEQNRNQTSSSVHLEAQLNDNRSEHLRLPSSSASDLSLPLASEQQHRRNEFEQISSQRQQLQRQTRSLSQDHLLQTMPVDIASGNSPVSVGSSSDVIQSISAASQVRNRSRNNSSSNHRDTELPTWVSRAYKEVSAEQTSNVDRGQTSSRHNQEPQQQQHNADAATPDVVINTGASPNRFKVWGGSSVQYLFKFTDVCLAAYGYDATAPLFRHGMAQSDEFDMPLASMLPELPSRTIVSHCMESFFGRIWPIFPVIDRDAVESDVNILLSLQGGGEGLTTTFGLQSRIQSSQVPGLVILYAIVCIGLNEIAPTDPISMSIPTGCTAATYVSACYSLHAHLTAMPYQSSVQALFLLALGLRACGKDGQSWSILGLALRLAMSLGLHKSVEWCQQEKLRLQDSSSLQRRLWWSCFSFERLLQLECGRSSSIDSTFDYGSLDSNLSIRLPGFGQWHSAQSHTERSEEEPISEETTTLSKGRDSHDEVGELRSISRLFTAWVSLSAIMGQISDRFYNHRFGHALELLGETARLAHCLKKWEAGLPEHLKPQSNSHSIGQGGTEVAIAFLAQQFYHAKMAVLRIAILFPHHSFQKEVQLRSLELADIRQLSGAASQCVSSSRSLIMLTLQLADAGIQSTLNGVQQTFLASIVLALSILRSPRSRLVGSDIELLTEATTFVEAGYKAWGYPASYLEILSRLRERTSAVSRGQVQLVVPSGSGATQLEAPHQRKDSIHLSHALPSKVATPAAQSNGHQSLGKIDTLNAGVSCAPPEQVTTFSSLGHSDDMDGGMNAKSSLLPFTSETSMEALTGMEFDDFWDMLKADIFT